MPFTVSHIAAVVPAYQPLSRARVFSAAVIGSMVPDFGLLLPGTFARWQTHSLPGLFSFCLPVGLLAYGLILWLIKPALLEVLPDGSHTRLCASPRPSLNSVEHWLYVLLALLGGAGTHLIWDAFTHENARGVRMFPLLTDYGPEMSGHPLHLYRWLQYGSSVVGLVVVIAALLLWLAHAPSPPAPPARQLGRNERVFWLAVYPALPLAAMGWDIVRRWSMGWPFSSAAAIGGIAILGMRSTAISLLLVSALIRVRVAS